MTNSSNSAELSPETAPATAQPSKAQKYLFDTVFDYSETKEDVQSITPKQMAEAKVQTQEKSYDEGYKKGIEETNESIARTAGDQLFVITGKIDELIESEKEILETFHTQVAQVSELVTSMVLPTLAKKGALDEVKTLLEQSYSKLPKEQKITIEVQEPLVDLISQHIQDGTKSEDFKAQIAVIAGPNFQPTDCKISWDGAGIEHYMSNVMAEIKDTLMRLGGKPLEMPVETEINETQPTNEAEA